MSDRAGALIEAFKQARAEILKRVDHREYILRAYFIASITFIGGALFRIGGIETANASIYSVMPATSLAVALYVYYQSKTIHGLAEFIRRELEPAIEAEIGGAFLHYDRSNTARSFNLLRTASSQLVTFASVHFLGLLSLGFAWRAVDSRDEAVIAGLATACFLLSVFITVLAKWHRWRGPDAVRSNSDA